MIYCNLKGGLGNMLFQIATAISFSTDRSDECFFPNLSEQINYLNRESTYNPKLNYANEYLELFKNLKIKNIEGNSFYIEYPFHYVEHQLPNGEVIIDGFFQSEKYFKNNRKEILEVLDFSFIDQDILKSKYPFIGKKTTSIHVRRGDYLSHPNHHPVQSIEYYYKGIELLKNDTELFVIFSDDIEWFKENIKLENVVYIEEEKDYNELYLMSLCDNNIISNSSFSWWGAWLNENKNKKVIGPKLWFGNKINHNTSDILPESWIKI
jgi:hypothetical protein